MARRLSQHRSDARPAHPPRSTWRLLVLIAGAALFAAALPGLANARALPPCDDHAAPASAANAPIELLTNEKRPTIEIALADNTQDDADVTLTSRPALPEKIKVAAELNDTPARGARELRGVSLGAAPNASGTGVVVHVCVGRSGSLSPGRYEGSLRVYGPTIKPFDYPLTVTIKAWKLWAILILAGGVGLAVLVGWWTGALRFGGDEKGRLIVGYFVAVLLMLLAGGASYYSAYNNNATWGDDPAKDFPAIAIAGFSAASAALVVLHKLLAKPSAEGG